jgi:hypothetical protein
LAGLPTVLLLHVVIGTALDTLISRHLYVNVSLDDLITAIGWDPRSRREREAQRHTTWRWIALFDAMKVIVFLRRALAEYLTLATADHRKPRHNILALAHSRCSRSDPRAARSIGLQATASARARRSPKPARP